MRRTDELFGQVLERVRPHDAVMVVGPAHSEAGVTLTPLAIRGPATGEPGLLTSSTTRRDGFAQIQDVAPTILRLVGLPIPTAMEGEAIEPGGHGPSDRLEFLRDADAAAQFRDDRVGEVYALLVVAVAVTVGLVFASVARGGRWRGAAGYAAFATLGLIPATFLARLVPFQDHGAGAYFGFLLAVALVLGGVYAMVARRNVIDGAIVGLLMIVGLLTLDALRGAPLVLNSALGYSPTVAGRFAGFGNPAYAAYSAAALLAACLLAYRLGGRRGLPSRGRAARPRARDRCRADVGIRRRRHPLDGARLRGDAGLLAGRRIRVRTVALIIAGIAVVGAIASAIDLSRPREDRTHLVGTSPASRTRASARAGR